MAIPASIEAFSGQSPSTPTVLKSALEASRRLTELLTQAETDCARDRLSDNLRDRIADTLDILRGRLGRRVERDPRSLFDLDDRLIDLMDRIEEATGEGGEVPQSLVKRSTSTWRHSEGKSTGSPDIGDGKNRSPRSAPTRRNAWMQGQRPRLDVSIASKRCYSHSCCREI